MAREENGESNGKLKRKSYEKELRKLQTELCRLQDWVKHNGLRVIVIFEGRDGAGKGGTIRAITERVSPRVFRVIALPAPSDREKSQMYMQHFPAAGEVVIFDRSWYNRAGVEYVMGFCTPKQHERFLKNCPDAEHYITASGIILIKYWLEVSNKEQERRFKARIEDPSKGWKLSPMDLEARAHWVDYAEAKDDMFALTDTKECPWFVVDADDKRTARLNLIAHLLSLVPYQHVPRKQIKLPPRQKRKYERPPRDTQTYVPQRYIVE